MKKAVGIFALSAAIAISSNVNAEGFDGAEVTATAYCCTAPIEADRISVPFTKTVGPGIEFPSGSLQQTTGSPSLEQILTLEAPQLTSLLRKMHRRQAAHSTAASSSFPARTFNILLVHLSTQCRPSPHLKST